MLLVADVGNTNTTIGVFDGGRLRVSWRLTSRREQTADEYGVFIETLLRTRGIQPQDVTGIAISNVVPPVQQTLEGMCEKYFARTAFFVEPGVNTGLVLAVENPREVGPDRILGAVAGEALYGAPLIVIDFGTATTFNCVNARREFIGGAIAPGLGISVEALISRAARLFRVELVQPPQAIGRDTITNIQSGIVYGWAGLVDGIVDRMKHEMGGAPAVVATGGLVSLIAGVTRSIQHVNPDLKLEGLRLLYERAGGAR
ncbi:MAG: pantothenate kinase [Candidatus Rokubacteria bacterium 13_1_40CM_69_27]|nr:MAG: pantothenate kinase [Candidatus Rokubacteria bacterium 13_1_40CM_69_27]OLC39280.1 MAG: pantothenate kinase [Candidatus Rokubacteria bacterium 13_1_40CM_4_69_5]OLE37165.1 MAG: pantothenate kinase [Candidatus Rokubacteria bacterium 13_1_20CM_2_70_7]